MNEIAPDTLTVLPDPRLFRAARWMQRICLGVTATAIVSGLIPLFGTGKGFAAARGSVWVLATALMCGVSLLLSEPDRTGVAIGYTRRIANLFAILAAAWIIYLSRIPTTANDPTRIIFPQSRLALGFVALAVIVILIDNSNWLINRIVDVLVCALCLLGLLLISEALFGEFVMFGSGAEGQSAAPLVCLISLTVVVALRQAEHGVFSIFLGVGIGSKLARIFAPILLVLPLCWEAVNARMNHSGSANHLNAAVLASAAVGVAVGILLFFAWRISKMENQIHDLILRDEATRLYNFRGFHMLAEHALRLAQRSGVPFSVLFVDLENLAQVHTLHGPNAAAAALAEAGDILRSTFRESDIKGRIGGDEFAVAGQFDRAGISVAALRLEAATAARNTKSGRTIPLKFSMGHVTTAGGDSQESLKEMLDRAGQIRNRQDGLLKEMHVN